MIFIVYNAFIGHSTYRRWGEIKSCVYLCWPLSWRWQWRRSTGRRWTRSRSAGACRPAGCWKIPDWCHSPSEMLMSYCSQSLETVMRNMMRKKVQFSWNKFYCRKKIRKMEDRTQRHLLLTEGSDNHTDIIFNIIHPSSYRRPDRRWCGTFKTLININVLQFKLT